MPSLQLKTQELIFLRIIQRTVARTKLSDLTDTSYLKHLISAFSREIDDVYYQLTRLSALFNLDKAEGDDLDARAKDIAPGLLRRRGPLKSIGTLVFSRATADLSALPIPAGTVVKRSSDGTGYVTVTAAQIASGQTQSTRATALAVIAGKIADADAGAINAFQTKPPGVVAVTNDTNFSRGRDEESDDDFRARIQAYVLSLARSTVAALETAAANVEDPVTGKRVSYAAVYEDIVNRGNVTIYIDDGAGTARETSSVIAEPVIASAIGGEEFLDLQNRPVDLRSSFTLIGGRTLGVDTWLDPATARLFFSPPLVTSEAVSASYAYFTGLIAAVQRVIDGDRTRRDEFPGYRAAGVQVRVDTPTIVPFLIEAVLDVAPGQDFPSITNAVQSALLEYVNGLGVGNDVVRNALIERIMEVPHVRDVSLIEPSENITIREFELARITVDDVGLS